MIICQSLLWIYLLYFEFQSILSKNIVEILPFNMFFFFFFTNFITVWIHLHWVLWRCNIKTKWKCIDSEEKSTRMPMFNIHNMENRRLFSYTTIFKYRNNNNFYIRFLCNSNRHSMQSKTDPIPFSIDGSERCVLGSCSSTNSFNR